uniref:FTH domain-containing protein n=1 Tax=Panagrellus redivivus TaxID=6233 RepID=A0A7E4UXL5_PANRE
MPFPFHRLHCDLQIRLRELVSPHEAYDIQIAVGDTPNYLHPIQPLINEDEFYFIHRDDDLIDDNDGFNGLSLTYATDVCNLPLDKNELHTINKLIVATDISEADSKFLNSFYANAILNIKDLRIQPDDFIHASTLTQLSSLCSKECRELTFWAQLNDNMNLQLVLTLFPNIKYLSIYVKDVKKWCDALMEMKVTGLETLIIQLAGIHSTLRPEKLNILNFFKPKSLYQFCKVNPKFKLELLYSLDYDCFEPPIWDALKPFFLEVHDGDSAKLVLSSNRSTQYAGLA